MAAWGENDPVVEDATVTPVAAKALPGVPPLRDAPKEVWGSAEELGGVAGPGAKASEHLIELAEASADGNLRIVRAADPSNKDIQDYALTDPAALGIRPGQEKSFGDGDAEVFGSNDPEVKDAEVARQVDEERSLGDSMKSALDLERQAAITRIALTTNSPVMMVTEKFDEFQNAVRAAGRDPVKFRQAFPYLVPLFVKQPEMAGVAVRDRVLGGTFADIVEVYAGMSDKWAKKGLFRLFDEYWEDTTPAYIAKLKELTDAEASGAIPKGSKQKWIDTKKLADAAADSRLAYKDVTKTGLIDPELVAAQDAKNREKAGKEAFRESPLKGADAFTQLFGGVSDKETPGATPHMVNVGDETSWEAQQQGWNTPGLFASKWREARKGQELSDVGNDMVISAFQGEDLWPLTLKKIALQQEGRVVTDFGDGTLATWVGDVVQLAASQYQTFLGGGIGLAAGKVAQVGLNRMVPGLGTGTGLLASGVANAPKILGFAGGWAASLRLETGSAMIQYLDTTTDDGQKIDPRMAAAMAVTYGTIAATIEVATEFGPVLGMLGPLGDAVRNGSLKELQKTLLVRAKDSTYRQLLGRVAAASAKGIHAEGMEEIYQNTVQDVVEYLGRVVTAGGKLQNADFKASLIASAESYRSVAMGMGAHAVGASPIHFRSLAVAKQTSERDVKLADAIRAGADSATARANPGFWGQIVAEHTNAYGIRIESLWVEPKEGFLVLFQDPKTIAAGVVSPEAADAATRLLGPDGGERLREAVATGTKLEIPLATFAETIAGTPLSDHMGPHTTASRRGVTAWQAQVAQAEEKVRVQEALKGLEEKPDEIQPEEAALVRLGKDLKKIGKMTADEATEAVRVWRAKFRTTAARMNMTAAQKKVYIDQYVVRVRQEADRSILSEDGDAIRAATSGSKQMNETLGKGIYADQHTPLANGKAWEQYNKRERKGVFVFIDLNHLKAINDQLGHGVGNFTIQSVGEMLSSESVAQAGRGFRIGGDEFVFHFMNREQARMFQMGVQDKSRALPALAGNMKMSLSLGVGGTPDLADKAMYVAKERSKKKELTVEQQAFLRKEAPERARLIDQATTDLFEAGDAGKETKGIQAKLDAWVSAENSLAPEKSAFVEWDDAGIEELAGPMQLSQDPFEVAHTFWGKVYERASDTMTRLVADLGEDVFSDPGYQEARADFERAVEARRALGDRGDIQTDPSLNGRPIWSGLVDLATGEIVEQFTYEQAQDADFHDTLLLSPEGNATAKAGTHAYFWLEGDGSIHGDGLTPAARLAMRESIRWFGIDVLEQRLKYVPVGREKASTAWQKLAKEMRGGLAARSRSELAAARKRGKVSARESVTLEQMARDYAASLPAESQPKTTVEWTDFIEDFGDSIGLTFSNNWAREEILDQNPRETTGGEGRKHPTSLGELDIPTRLIVFKQLDKLANSAQIYRDLVRFAGTAWVRQAIQGALVREAIENILAGVKPAHDSVLNTPASAKLKAYLEAEGENGLFKWLNEANLLGKPEKPGLAVNGSFLNCQPSEACVTWCFATDGNYAYPHLIARSEVMQLAIEKNPERAGVIIVRQFKAHADFEAGKALRFFDKGDMSPPFLKVFAKMEQEGVRAAIFSKQAGLLAKVSEFHLRLLSVDASNRESLVQNPQLPAAYVYNGTEEDAAWVNAHKEMIAVVLPVIIGRQFLSKASIDRLDPELRPHVCPVDKGVVSLHEQLYVKNTAGDIVATFGLADSKGPLSPEVRKKKRAQAKAAAEKIGGTVYVPKHQDWRCTDCDAGGGVGCYYGRTTAEVASVSGEVTAEDWVATIHEINTLARDPKLRADLLAELRTLVREAQEGTLRGAEGETVREGDASALDARRSGSRPGYFNILEQAGKPAVADVGTFYSTAELAVLASKDEKAKGARWWALLQRTAKAEELEWVAGLKEWLAQPESRTREDVAAFIRANGLKVKVNVFRHGEEPLATAKAEHEENLKSLGIRTFIDNADDEGLQYEVQLNDLTNGRPRFIYGNSGEISQELRDIAENEGRAGQPTAQESAIREAIMAYEEVVRDYFDSTNEELHEGYTVGSYGGPKHVPGSYEVWGLFTPGVAEEHRTHVFGDLGDGMVGWARVTVHVLPSGEKMLFVEEIQSDLHAAAKKAVVKAKQKLNDIFMSPDRGSAGNIKREAYYTRIIEREGYDRPKSERDAAYEKVKNWIEQVKPMEIRTTGVAMENRRYWAISVTGEWYDRNVKGNTMELLRRVNTSPSNVSRGSIAEELDKVVANYDPNTPEKYWPESWGPYSSAIATWSPLELYVYDTIANAGWQFSPAEWGGIRDYILAERFASEDDARMFAGMKPMLFTPSISYVTEDILTRFKAPEEILAAQRISAEEQTGATDAPYKNQAFREVMQRYILRQAAVQGFKHIGWTTGEQQAKRYSTLNVVDEVGYNVETQTFIGSMNGAAVTTQKLAHSSNLGDWVGAEVANSLLNRPVVDGWQTLKRDGIRVAEEGRKGFFTQYDQAMPSYFEKLTKKDGGFAEIISLTAGKETATVDDILVPWETARAQMLSFLQMAQFRIEDNYKKYPTLKNIPNLDVKRDPLWHASEVLQADIGKATDATTLMQALGYDPLHNPLPPAEAVPLFLRGFGERWGMNPKDVIKATPGFKAWRMEVPEATAEGTRANGVTLFQEGGGKGPNGWTRFIKEGTKRLYEVVLSDKSNASTFMHESAHIFMEILAEMSDRADAPAQVREDFAKILRFIGVADRAELLARFHAAGAIREKAAAQQRELTDSERARIADLVEPFEKWARGFEAYLWEGKSPSDYLESTFASFKLWMGSAYSTFSDLNVTLNPEIRGVFDRMLATDAEINGAVDNFGFRSLFRSPEEAGMTGEEWQKHLALMRTAMSHAKLAAQHATAKRIQAITEKWWKAEVAKRVEALLLKYHAQPAAQLMRALKRGEATGNAYLDALLFQAKKQAMAGMATKVMPKEVKDQLASIDEKINDIEYKRRTAAAAGTEGTEKQKATAVSMEMRNPLGPVSLVVDRSVVVTAAGDVFDLSPGDTTKEGDKFFTYQMPEWLTLEEYLRDREAWNWVWEASSTSAPRDAQTILFHYAKQAVESDKGQRFSFNYQKIYRLAAIMGLNDQRGTSRRGATARSMLAAWVKEDPGTRARNPIPDQAWLQLIKGGADVAAHKWFSVAQFHIDRNDHAWLKPANQADLAKPRRAFDPQLATDQAKIEELRKARAIIVEKFTSEAMGKARGRLKLAYGQVSELVGKKALTFFRSLLAPAGADINEMATALNFPDAKTMIEAAMALPEPKKYAREQAEAEVTAAHPEVAVDRERMKDIVSKGIAGDATLHWLLHELDVLRVKIGSDTARRLEALGAGTSGVATEAIRRAANGLVGEKVIGKLDVGSAFNAANTASEKALEAAAKDDYALAYVHRHEQILNLLIYRALVDAKEDRDSLQEIGKTLNGQRARWGKVNPIWRDGLDTILEVLGLANVPAPTKARAHVSQLIGWWEAKDDGTKEWHEGLLERSGGKILYDSEMLQDILTNPPQPLEEGGEVWKALTVNQARTVWDALKNIYGTMLDTERVIVGAKREQLDDTVLALIDEIVKNLPARENLSSSTAAEGSVEWLYNKLAKIDSDLLKMETVINWIGGRDPTSLWVQTFTVPMQAAKHREADLHKGIVLPIIAAMDNIPSAVRKRFRDKIDGKALFPDHREGIDPPSRRFELMTLALNRGNLGNLRRLMEGRGMTLEQVDAALSLLTKEEMRWVQGVWDALSRNQVENGKNLWQLSRDLDERENGLAPKEVEATPFEINGIVYAGGYYPAAYDRRIATGPEADITDVQGLLMGNRYVGAYTRHDFLKSRSETFSDVVALDPSIIQGHLVNVIHDLAFREIVKSTGRLLFDQRIQAVLKERLGYARFPAFINWVRDVGSMRGAEVVVRARGINNLFRALRANQAFSVLGYAVDIPVGDTSNLPVYGVLHPENATYLAGAIADLMGDRKKFLDEMLAKSGELRFRRHKIRDTWNHSMREFTRRRGIGMDAYYAFMDHSFDFFDLTDRMTATPIFMAGYRGTLERTGDEQLAIEVGNAHVREIFPSHHAVDSSELLRDRGFVGSTLLFFGYLNAIYNRRRDITHDLYLAVHDNELRGELPTGWDSTRGFLKVLPQVTWRLMALVVAYQVLGEWLSGRGKEDNEEPWEWWLRKMLMGMTVNDLPFGSLVEPVVTKIVTGSAKRISVRSAPGFSAMEGFGRSMMSAMDGDQDAQRTIYNLLKATSMLAGVPYRPLRAGNYLLDLAQGDTTARAPYVPDIFSGMVYSEHAIPVANPATDVQDVIDAVRKP